MEQAGIREARQNLSGLLEKVKAGTEIVITDRGRPVARLVPPSPPVAAPFPSLGELRSLMPVLTPPLSSSVENDREDRL